MPHVIVKLWPGKSDAQKRRLAERITEDVIDVFDYSADAISVAMEEVSAEDWAEQVYRPDILADLDKLYKKPGYAIVDLPRRRI